MPFHLTTVSANYLGARRGRARRDDAFRRPWRRGGASTTLIGVTLTLRGLFAQARFVPPAPHMVAAFTAGSAQMIRVDLEVVAVGKTVGARVRARGPRNASAHLG